MDPQPQEPQQDLSKRTLVMLVLLSCVISLVGTVAMIYEFSTSNVAPTVVENNGAANGEAGFEILPQGQQQPQPANAGAVGYATFNIGE